MNATHSSGTTRFKVGVFTVVGLIFIAIFTVMVNGRPYWWRPCQLVYISIEDATGLKTKSPIRSLGIEIGYLKSVSLSETHVTLGICITAPVEILPTTRAYIRGEGFLGDKFVELKPVKYIGPQPKIDQSGKGQNEGDEDSQLILPQSLEKQSFWKSHSNPLCWLQGFLELIGPMSAWAASDSDPPARKGRRGTEREIPVGGEGEDVQHLVGRVDELVHQMTDLTNNLREAINPEDLRRMMRQLNQTLENASKTLAPEGGLNQTAQRTLAKLEDAIEQLRDLMTRVNKGEGSVGMLLNDPTYAEEIRKALVNLNHLLNKVQNVRFVMDIGAVEVTGYNGGRGWLQVGIWPQPDRYYLLGISVDPRGRITNATTTTTAGGFTQVVQTQTVEQTGLLLTGMVGKIYFQRFDVSIGALYGDGAASIAFRLGPEGSEDRLQIRNDVYFRNSASPINDRITIIAAPIPNIYFRAGLESFSGYDGTGRPILFFGGGIKFDDEDLKLLFTLK